MCDDLIDAHGTEMPEGIRILAVSAGSARASFLSENAGGDSVNQITIAARSVLAAAPRNSARGPDRP